MIPAGHKLELVKSKEATHDTDGNVQYYICTVCNKVFKDDKASEEIALEDTVIAKTGHDYGSLYKNDADNHWKECACGSIAEKETHNFNEWVVVKEATESENGLRERTCAVCGYTMTEEIPATGTGAGEPSDPEIPDEENNSTDSDNNDNDSPQTGDMSEITLHLLLIVVAAVGVGVTFTIIKRSKRIN